MARKAPTRPAKKAAPRPRKRAIPSARSEPLGEVLDSVVDEGTVSTVAIGQALALRDMAGGQGMRPPSEQSDRFRRRPVREIIRESLRIGDLRRTPYGLTPAILFAATGLVVGLNSRAFAVAGPEIARDLELNLQQIISIGAVIGFFTIFSNLFIGWWADRHRRVPLLAIGTIVSGLFGMLVSRGTSMATLGAPKVGQEVAELTADVPGFALITDYYPVETRGRAFAFLGVLRRAGTLLSIFLVGGLVTGIGWRPTLLIFGAAVAVMGVVLLVRLREPIRGYMDRRAVGADEEVARTEDDPMSFGEGWRTTWGIRTLRRYFLSDVFAAFPAFFSIYLAFFIFEKYGLNAFQRSLIAVPGVVAALFFGFLGGGMIDYFVRRNPSRVLVIIGVYQLIGSLSILLYLPKPPIWVLVLIGIPFGIGGALIGPAAAVVYAQVIPASIRTQGIQVFGLSQLPALFIGTPLAIAVFTAGGYNALFLLGVPFGVVGAVLAISAAGFFDLDIRSSLAASVASEEWRRAKREGKGKLLVCRDIDVSYGTVQVLFNVDFDVEEGEIIALLGTNGAGKSTLLRAISGTSEAAAGAIVFDGRDITHMPPHEIAARGVVFMPGGRGVFPGLSVRENLLLGNWMNDASEVEARMAEVHGIFPVLRDRAETLASDLSGGEQQQLSLAQAFLAKPRLLMIDELSLGLAPAVVAQLLDIVRAIRKRGVTIIVVEQSVNVALTIAEKAIFMEKGEVKFFGRTADLLARPDILRAVYVKGTGALTTGGGSARRTREEQRAMELGDARPILEVRDLVKRYGGVTAVDGVSFGVREGEVLGLIGPNGAGKTTIFDIISGFQEPDAGSVWFEGVDISGLSPEARARRKLIRRFQEARLFPSLTVFETLLVALEQSLEVKSAVLNGAGLPQARRAERRLRLKAERLIDLLDLSAFRDKFVKELSTGLRRILDVACVLANEPRVLLLDEPSSGIAQREAENLAPLLRRVRFETNCSILIIEHDMPLISSVSDELLALDRGRAVVRGTPDAVLNDERVIESYLGTSEAAMKRSGALR